MLRPVVIPIGDLPGLNLRGAGIVDLRYTEVPDPQVVIGALMDGIQIIGHNVLPADLGDLAAHLRQIQRCLCWGGGTADDHHTAANFVHVVVDVYGIPAGILRTRDGWSLGPGTGGGDDSIEALCLDLLRSSLCAKAQFNPVFLKLVQQVCQVSLKLPLKVGLVGVTDLPADAVGSLKDYRSMAPLLEPQSTVDATGSARR